MVFFIDGILHRPNHKIFKKIARLVSTHVTSRNFLNVSIVEFNELEVAILNLGPKHVFRNAFKVPDIVSAFEKASYIVKLNGNDTPLVSAHLELLKEEYIKANGHNKPSKIVKNLLQKLKESSVIVTRADKETKLVAMNKDDYLNGLLNLLGDASKFVKYVPPPKKKGRPTLKNVFELA